MKSIRKNITLTEDGEIHLSGLPYRKGDSVDLVLTEGDARARPGTAGDLLRSGLVGMWADRADIEVMRK